MKKSFILHHDTLNVLDELTDEQAGKLFKAIFNYHIGMRQLRKTQRTQSVI